MGKDQETTPPHGYLPVQTISISTPATSAPVGSPLLSYLKHAINLGSYLSGAVHGFCDAQQIPLADNTELALTWAPTVVRTLYSSLSPILLFGGIGTVVGACVSLQKEKPEALETIVSSLGGGAVGTGIGIAMGGTYGAVNGAVRTMVGYGFGYAAGSVLPKF